MFSRVRHSPRDFIKALIVLAIAGPVLVGGSAAAAFFMLPLPAIVPAPTPSSQAQTSFVYAADGSLIATFHSEHNRELIGIDQMPKHLQLAAIASEDARFYQHTGIDKKAITRALLADIRARSTVQGGSTITQQYVKNAYIASPKRTVLRKVTEALIASQVERTYTKEKILENYLNTVYMGKGAYGVEAAAKTYFNKKASELTISESAMLVGLIPAPVRYSPYENPQSAESRRQFVVGRMEKLGFIDEPTAAAVRAEVPALAPLKQEVFRYPWFVDAVRRTLTADKRYGSSRVFGGGLRIYTTLDPRLQDEAEKSIYGTLNKPKDPYGALVAIDPRTGYVQALVGGRNYNEEKFNLALQAHRQPGSAFKPFVMVAALEEGKGPGTRYNSPGKYCGIKGYKSKDGCIRNYGGSGFGSIAMDRATHQSVNTYYIQLARDVGIDKVFDAASRMGFSEASIAKDRKDKNLAVALGGFTTGVTPLEMASAYATLAANGVYHKPKFISKVTDSSGRVIEQGPSPGVQAIDPNVAANANKILTGVITSGTARKADIGRPAAGKTGTAQDFKNAWFVGYTPDLSTAVWMGHRKATIPMLNVKGVRNVTGGTLPAEMWAKFMKTVLEGVPPTEFEEAGAIQRKSSTGFRLPAPSGPRPSPSPTPTPDDPSPIPSESPSPSPSPSRSPRPVISIIP